MSVAASQLWLAREDLTMQFSKLLAVHHHRWAIMGERRAYTDTYNCGDSLTDWTFRQKSGEHVNIHITDCLDEVISMNLV